MKQILSRLLLLGLAAAMSLSPAASASAQEAALPPVLSPRPGVFVKDAPALRGAGTMTVEGWFWLESAADGVRLVSKYGNSKDARRGWELVLQNGAPRFRINCLMADGTQQEFAAWAKEPLPLRQWVHIAASFQDDGNEARSISVYVDGRLAMRRQLPEHVALNPNSEINVMAGAYGEGFGAGSHLLLDELRLSSRVPEFSGTPPAAPWPDDAPGTLALFHFDAVDAAMATAPGITAGIVGKAQLVPGRFGMAIDLRGDGDDRLFHAIAKFGQAVPLSDVVEGDFLLPWHTTQENAQLCLRNLGKEPLALQATVALDGNPPPAGRRYDIDLVDDAVLQIPLAGLEDGRWLVTIALREGASGPQGKVLRFLRIQRPLPPPAAPSPAPMAGRRLFPVDDYHIASRQGTLTRAKTYDTIEVTASEGELQDTSGDDWLGRDEQGRFCQRVRTVDRDGTPSRNLCGVREWDGSRRNLPPKTQFTPFPPVALKPFPHHHSHGGEKRPNFDLCEVRFLEEADGMPPLKEVRVWMLTPEMGDVQAKGLLPWAVYAFWEKTPGHWLVLTREPIAKAKFSYAETELEGPLDANDCFGDTWIAADGRLCYAQTGRLRRFAPFIVEYDNIPSGYRQMRQFMSRDGVHWETREIHFIDERDHWSVQHYGSSIRRLEDDFYVTLVCRYHVLTQQLAPEAWFSRDGLEWFRPEQPATLIRNTHTPGSWLFGMVFTHSNTALLENDGRWFLSVSGWTRRPHFYFLYGIPAKKEGHSVERLKRGYQYKCLAEKWPFFREIGGWQGLSDGMDRFNTVGSTSGFADLRAYGFFAAETDSQGELVTRPLLAPGCRLQLNGAGIFKAELLDRQGNPIPGYSGRNAARFTGDSVEEPLAFGTNATLPEGEFCVKVSMLGHSELYTLFFQPNP